MLRVIPITGEPGFPIWPSRIGTLVHRGLYELQQALKKHIDQTVDYQGVEYAAALIVGRRQIFDVIKKNAGHFFARVQIGGDVVLLEPQSAEAVALTSREKTKRKYGQRLQET